MKIFFLVMITMSILNADFTRDSDGIVTDSVAGLSWQDNETGIDTAWEVAINDCESLTLGNNTDWRLPTVNELKSIVDRSQEPLVIVSVFQNTEYKYYWSSTSYLGAKSRAWSINFYSGVVLPYEKTENRSSRCVRGTQP